MFKVEVIADSTGQFYGNGLEFETPLKAQEYARDLYSRWTGVKTWRVIRKPGDGLSTIDVVCTMEAPLKEGE